MGELAAVDAGAPMLPPLPLTCALVCMQGLTSGHMGLGVRGDQVALLLPGAQRPCALAAADSPPRATPLPMLQVTRVLKPLNFKDLLSLYAQLAETFGPPEAIRR